MRSGTLGQRCERLALTEHAAAEVYANLPPLPARVRGGKNGGGWDNARAATFASAAAAERKRRDMLRAAHRACGPRKPAQPVDRKELRHRRFEWQPLRRLWELLGLSGMLYSALLVRIRSHLE